MLKRILITFLIVPVIGGAIYGYFYFKQVKTPLTPVIKAIPAEAVCIVKARGFNETWKSFSGQNNFWKELLSVKAFSEIDQRIRFFDSVFVKGSKSLKLDEHADIFLSAYADSINGVEFLLAFNIPLTAEKRAVNDLVEAAVPNVFTRKDELVNGVSIRAYAFPRGKSFYYYHSKSIFAFSFSKELIAQSAANLSTPSALLQDRSFTRVLKTTSGDAQASVLVNFRNLSGLLPRFLNEENRAFVNTMADFARWISMDLKLGTDQMALNGYTYANDSLNDFLSVYRKQEAPVISMTNIIPVNTAFFTYSGISQPSRFIEDLHQYKLSSGRFDAEVKKRRQVENRYGIDIPYFFKSWMGREMAMVVTESLEDEYRPDNYAIFAASDTTLFRKLLADLKQSIAVNDSNYNDSSFYVYRGYTIEQLDIPDFVQLVFGASTGHFSTNWISVIGKYVVFAPSQDALQSLINFYTSGRTIGDDKDYQKFASQLSSSCNFYVYSAVARSAGLYKQHSSASLGNEIQKNTSVFRKFQALALQFSSRNDLFYNTLCLKYNPVYVPQYNTLWEFTADASLHHKPSLLKLNDSTSVFLLQDAAKNLYLVSADGKLIWKKSIVETMMGEAKMLNDATGSFIFFNTRHYLFCMNASGEMATGFPVTLPSEATVECGLFITDARAQILLATANLSIYSYNTDGSINQNWRTERLKDTLKTPFRFLSCDGRDMVISVDQGRNIKVLDKHGNWVVKLPEKLPAFSGLKFELEIRKSINASAIWVNNEEGTLFRYNFKGKFDRFESPVPLKGSAYAGICDLDGDGKRKLFYAGLNKLCISDRKGNCLFSRNFPENLAQAPELVKFNDSVSFIAVQTLNNHLFLFDRNGVQNRNMAFASSAIPVPLSIDNGKYHFAVTISGNKLMAYALANTIVPSKDNKPKSLRKSRSNRTV